MRKLALFVVGVGLWGLSPIICASEDEVIPAGQSVTVEYFQSDTIATVVDTVVISRRIINRSNYRFVGLYLSDNIPTAFVVRGFLATVNRSPVPTQYQVLPAGSVIAGYSVHHWVFDAQDGSAIDLVLEPGDTLELTIAITCASAAQFELPLHTMVCYDDAVGGLFAVGEPASILFSLDTGGEDDQGGGDDDEDDAGNDPLPRDYLISSAYPNPFNGAVTISYSGANMTIGSIELDVYNQLGQLMYHGSRDIDAADGMWAWDPAAGTGSGVYFYRLSSGTSASRGKLMLVK